MSDWTPRERELVQKWLDLGDELAAHYSPGGRRDLDARFREVRAEFDAVALELGIDVSADKN